MAYGTVSLSPAVEQPRGVLTHILERAAFLNDRLGTVSKHLAVFTDRVLGSVPTTGANGVSRDKAPAPNGAAHDLAARIEAAHDLLTDIESSLSRLQDI